MTTDTWTGAESGSWDDAANWSTGTVPGPNDTAVINVPGSYLISVPNQTDVGAVVLDDSAAVLDAGGAFTVSQAVTVLAGELDVGNGFDAPLVSNAGSIDISSGGTLNAGTLSNSGLMTDAGALQVSSLDNTGTITGNGQLTLAGSFTTEGLGQIAGPEIVITGTLNNTGATFGLTGPSVQSSGGFIEGGTLANAVLLNSTTLDGVTILGSASGGNALFVADGLTSVGADGTGVGTLDFNAGVSFYFVNDETLSHVDIGSAGSSIVDGTLTIGSDVNWNFSHELGMAAADTFSGAGTVLSAATLTAVSTEALFGEADVSLSILNAAFDNSGLISFVDDSAAIGSVPPAGQDEGIASLDIVSSTFVNQSGGIIETGEAFGTGQIIVSSSTEFTNDGTILTEAPSASTGGTVDIATAVEGDGTIEIAGGGQVTLETTASAMQTIDFSGAGTLTLDHPQFIPSAIEGFGSADAIVLQGVPAIGLSYTDGDLKLQTQNGTIDLGITGAYTLGDFAITTGMDGSTVVTLGTSAPSADVSWVGGSSGSWNDAANWSSDSVPGPSDAVVIDAPGSYVVNVTSEISVGNLTLDNASAVLEADGVVNVGTSLTVLAGTVDVDNVFQAQPVSNAGSIDVSSAGVLNVSGLLNSGAITDSGSIALQALTNTGTITGSGQLVLGGSFTTAGLGQMVGPSIVLLGTLNNAGGILGLSGPVFSEGGLIEGGTLANAVLATSSTLDGVTILGSVVVSDTLFLTGSVSSIGMDGTGVGGLDVDTGGFLDFFNDTTLSHVDIAGSSGDIVDGTLTLDSSVEWGFDPNSGIGSGYSEFSGGGTVFSSGTFSEISVAGFLGSGGAVLLIQNTVFDNDGVISLIDESSVINLPHYPPVPEGVATVDISSATFVNQSAGIIEIGQDLGTGRLIISSATDFTNDGTILSEAPGAIAGGTVDIATAVQGDGTIAIAGGGAVTLEASASATQTIDFTSAGTLTLDQPGSVAAVIDGFGTADAIVLQGISAPAISYTDGDLKLQTANGTIDLGITGTYTLSSFAVDTAADGSAIITTATSAPSGTVTWVGSSGSWNDAANWSSDQVPGVPDNVVVDVPGSYLIEAPAPVFINSLVMLNAAAVLDDGDTFIVTNGVTLGAGEISIGGLLEASTLFNAGSISISGSDGSLELTSLSNSGIITDAGTLQVQSLTNAGTIAGGGQVVLTGSNSTAGLGQIDGPQIDLQGTLNNIGSTLGLNTSEIISQGGLIIGGTVTNLDAVSATTLDAVTILGSISGSDTVYIADSLTSVGMDGTGVGFLNFFPGVTFDFLNSATLSHVDIESAGSNIVDGTLTIGNDVNWRFVDQLPGGPADFVGSGTIFNSGTLSGVSTQALFAQGDVGLSVQNAVFANDGVISLVDASGLISGTVPGETEGLADLEIDSGTFTNETGGTIETGEAYGKGQIAVSSATAFTNDGTILTQAPSAAAGGTIDIATLVQGDGTIEIAGGGQVTLETGASAMQTVDFVGTGTLTLDHPQFVSGLIGGFQAADMIVLAGSATAISYSAGDLKLQTATGTVDLDLVGDFNTLAQLQINSGSDETTISLPSPPCFAAGSRIATTRGMVRVEDLREGDITHTVSGGTRPIQWIGHRHVDCRRHPHPEQVYPIRIAAHAFGQGCPSRALLLSPDHAVYVDDVLVPIKYLINGSTISRQEVSSVTYYHVELPKHDILLAEGLTVESYLETGGRSAFANGSEVMQLHPDFSSNGATNSWIWDAFAYAPLVIAPAQLAPIQQRLQRQAAALQTMHSRRRRRA